MTRDELIALAKETAATHGLDAALVCAVCEQESGWRMDATRFEPAFRRRYIDPLHLKDAEAVGRSTSWGLMQLMGEVARELGYTGDFAAFLSNAELALTWGCKHLAHKLKQANGDVHKALLLWNGGGRPAYADEVLARVTKFEENDETKEA